MVGRFYIEGAHYSLEQMRDALVVDGSRSNETPITSVSRDQGGDAVDAVVDILSSMHIGNKPMLQKDNDGYSFNYVGVIAAGSCLFPILPKYYVYAPEDPIPAGPASDALIAVLEAVRKYMTRSTLQEELQFSPADVPVTVLQNRLGLYRFLLEDYSQYGPYTNTRRIREFNGEGDIDWPRTIDQIRPVLSNGAPVYMELITSRRTRESSNFIARMQLAMLGEISTFIEGTGLNAILHMPLVKQSQETLDSLGDTAMLVRRLQRELHVQFETRKRLLLSNMLNYFKDYSPASKNIILAEGTGSFNLVWEDICKQIFHHDHTISMPKPNWQFLTRLEWNPNARQTDAMVSDPDAVQKNASEEFGTTEADTRTLIPDVVNTDQRDGNGNPVITILDAKYYIPQYKSDDSGKGHISGQPGIGDIIKQYFYMMALQHGLDLGLGKDRSKETALTIAGNAFILPAQRALGVGDGPEPRYLLVQRGRVSLEFMGADADKNEGRKLPSHILLFELDAEQAIDIYLHAVPSEAEALRYLHQMFDGQSETDFLKPKSIIAQPSAGKV